MLDESVVRCCVCGRVLVPSVSGAVGFRDGFVCKECYWG